VTSPPPDVISAGVTGTSPLVAPASPASPDVEGAVAGGTPGPVSVAAPASPGVVASEGTFEAGSFGAGSAPFADAVVVGACE